VQQRRPCQEGDRALGSIYSTVSNAKGVPRQDASHLHGRYYPSRRTRTIVRDLILRATMPPRKKKPDDSQIAKGTPSITNFFSPRGTNVGGSQGPSGSLPGPAPPALGNEAARNAAAQPGPASSTLHQHHPLLGHAARLHFPEGLIDLLHVPGSLTSTSGRALNTLAEQGGGGGGPALTLGRMLDDEAAVGWEDARPANDDQGAGGGRVGTTPASAAGATAWRQGALDAIRASLMARAPKPLNALQHAAAVAPGDKPLLILAGAGVNGCGEIQYILR